MRFRDPIVVRGLCIFVVGEPCSVNAVTLVKCQSACVVESHGIFCKMYV